MFDSLLESNSTDLLDLKESVDSSIQQILNEKLIVVGGGKRYGQVIFLAGGGGCYPAGTEFFTGKEWKPIEEYKEGDNVLQYNTDTQEASLTDNPEYIKLPVDQFYQIKNHRTDFTTSLHHKHLFINEKTGKYVTRTTEEILKQYESDVRGNTESLVTTFKYSGDGINLAEDQIRLKVALIVDGHILGTKNPKHRVSLKKDNKINRLRELLEANHISYKEYNENGFTRFEFYYIESEREFEDYWYDCSNEQLRIVCDEVLKWVIPIAIQKDRKPSKSFISNSKKSIDFVQFAFASIGRQTSIHEDIREGRIIKYNLIIDCSEGCGNSKENRSKQTTTIEEADADDGFMYCFTVPSGFFIVRQNGKIYVSGNSGKGFVIKNFLEGDKFKVRDVDAWKEIFLELSKTKDKYKEIRNLDLRKPKDVFALHQFVKDKGIKDKTLDLLLADTKDGRLPNIIFDVTMKVMDDLNQVVPRLVELGYNERDINIVWVLTNYRVAVTRNAERDRVVPEDILIQTHEGAASTMYDLVRGKIPKGVNGAIHVVLNNKENTILYKNPDGSNYRDSKGRTVIKDFTYITVKKAGSRINSQSKVQKQLLDWIRDNVPKTSKTKHLF